MALKKLILLIIICSSLQVFSQQKIEFQNTVKEQILNNYTGTLLVKTKKSLIAIDPKTQQVLWRNNDFEKVSFSEYSEIPYTPIILFTQKPLINSKVISNSFNTQGASKKLLNVVTGKVLFNSEKEGFKSVNNTLILPQKKAILVDGIKNKEFIISLYSYETGKQIWETKGVESNFFKTVKGAWLDEEKIILDIEKNIYWLKNKHLIKIDGKTGAILYKQDDINSIATNGSKDILFVFSNTFEIEKLAEENIINALDTRTLQNVWKAPVKIWGSISNTAIDQDKIVAITSKGFNIINIKTGAKKWKRSEPLPLIKKIVPVSNGYLIVQDKFLVRIDNKGKKAWDEKIKITFSSKENPIHIIENQNQALYITPSKANIVNIENGTKVWKEDVVLNSASFLDRNLKISDQRFKVWDDTRNSRVPLYSENSFYIFDKTFTKKPALVNGFDFKRGAPKLRIIDNGYFLYKNNTYFCYDLLGQLRYRKEYPYLANTNVFDDAFYWTKRGFGTYTSALGFVGNQVTQTLNTVLVSKDLGLLSTVSSGIYGTYQSYQNSLSNLTELNKLDLDSHMSTIFNRIKTGQKNNRSLIIVSANKVETKIIRLDIDSGTEEVIKTIKKTYSNFLVDQIEQQIYFFEKKHVLIEDLK
ncbi:outer membrane protein assembly factor BamB family protein [Winogradskyella immobilis]|uniref:PQQ-binding-like beta-propeller repeat protein n=1 Tax=Winogradskyella immobilis TaxID=2816852 RepID=A0ABS8ERB5_9FLAO|nr:PQQ-binding-like beta-propeller repeat protein [Winogradskyella immobilis]MCC1485407.1 PQQ-binding-like beta-propeller repeat protein [Winogradskyella immobilis]MCG0017499.1 PQQ-like beta-propeller repeat protein [Winogradskyella immobilis]